jgi:hypothetical protein
MPRPRSPLTPAIRDEICSYIRAGGFAHNACEAAGIPVPLYESWLRLAQRKRAAKRYCDFATAIRKAQAHARLAAESRMLQGNPLNWLKSGPGRESPDQVGWTSPTRPLASNSTGTPLATSGFHDLVTTILRVLVPYPEARGAVVQALDELEAAETNRNQPPAG